VEELREEVRVKGYVKEKLKKRRLQRMGHAESTGEERLAKKIDGWREKEKRRARLCWEDCE